MNRQSFYGQQVPEYKWSNYDWEYPELSTVPPAEAQGKGRPSPSAPTPAAPTRPSKGKGKGKQAAAQQVVSPAGVITGAKCASHFAAAEWTSAAKLTSPTQIRKALENGDPDFPGNVVLTRDPKNPE